MDWINAEELTPGTSNRYSVIVNDRDGLFTNHVRIAYWNDERKKWLSPGFKLKSVLSWMHLPSVQSANSNLVNAQTQQEIKPDDSKTKPSKDKKSRTARCNTCGKYQHVYNWVLLDDKISDYFFCSNKCLFEIGRASCRERV